MSILHTLCSSVLVYRIINSLGPSLGWPPHVEVMSLGPSHSVFIEYYHIPVVIPYNYTSCSYTIATTPKPFIVAEPSSHVYRPLVISVYSTLGPTYNLALGPHLNIEQPLQPSMAHGLYGFFGLRPIYPPTDTATRHRTRRLQAICQKAAIVNSLSSSAPGSGPVVSPVPGLYPAGWALSWLSPVAGTCPTSVLAGMEPRKRLSGARPPQIEVQVWCWYSWVRGIGDEDKKQRDQCGSSTQYTRVAYNGEKVLTLPLMPLFICVS